MYKVDFIFLENVIYTYTRTDNGETAEHILHHKGSKVNDWQFRSGRTYKSDKSLRRFVENPYKRIVLNHKGCDVPVERQVFRFNGSSWERIDR
jgi:hypothetical protein